MGQRNLGLGMVVVGGVIVIAGLIWLAVGGGTDIDVSAGDLSPTVTAGDQPAGSTTLTTTSTTTTITTTTSTTTVPVETAAEFLALLNAAFAGADPTMLVDRLNQATIDVYGQEACDAYLMAIVAIGQSEITMRAVVGVGPWDYVIDEITTPLVDVTSVEVSRQVNDETVVQELHWKLVGDRYTWFTDCGDPLPA